MPQAGYDLQMAADRWHETTAPAQSLKMDRTSAFIAGAHWARARDASLDRPPMAARPDVEISAPLDYVEVQDPPPSALTKLLQSLRSRF